MYFKNKNGFPDPRGELSLLILAQTIGLANQEVQAELATTEKLRREETWSLQEV